MAWLFHFFQAFSLECHICEHASTHSRVGHDALNYVTCLICIREMMYSYAWYDSFTSVTWHINTYTMSLFEIFPSCLVHTCDFLNIWHLHICFVWYLCVIRRVCDDWFASIVCYFEFWVHIALFRNHIISWHKKNPRNHFPNLYSFPLVQSQQIFKCVKFDLTLAIQS